MTQVLDDPQFFEAPETGEAESGDSSLFTDEADPDLDNSSEDAASVDSLEDLFDSVSEEFSALSDTLADGEFAGLNDAGELDALNQDFSEALKTLSDNLADLEGDLSDRFDSLAVAFDQGDDAAIDDGAADAEDDAEDDLALGEEDDIVVDDANGDVEEKDDNAIGEDDKGDDGDDDDDDDEGEEAGVEEEDTSISFFPNDTGDADSADAVIDAGDEADETGDDETTGAVDETDETGDDEAADAADGLTDADVDTSAPEAVDASTTDTGFVDEVVRLTNEFRAENGVAPLTANDELDTAAQGHSDDMAQADFFNHIGSDGSDPQDRAAEAGYSSQFLGENIAAGQTSPEDVVQAWIDSPGHRENMLRPQFTEIGVGFTNLADDTGSVNFNNYWTQAFGSGDTNPA
jgi:uncharacterized protein YkwD